MKKILEENRAFDLERVIVQRTPEANLAEDKKTMLENIDRAQLQALGKAIPFHSVSAHQSFINNAPKVSLNSINKFVDEIYGKEEEEVSVENPNFELAKKLLGEKK